MREILFRGKRVKDGEWVFGYYTELPEGDIGGTLMAGADGLLCEDTADYIVIIETKQCPSFSPAYPIQVFDADLCKVYPETIGQFTGLTDKNGKKIFEGDICGCFCNTQIFEVKYCKERCGYFLDDCVRSGDCEPAPECLGNLRNTMEVIGTIYDNPELLEAKE